MSTFKCFVCFQPSIEFPQNFKPVLTDFFRVLNKYQSSIDETRDVKFALRSSKIQQAQMSLLESGANLGNSQDFDTLTIKTIGEIRSKVNNEAEEVTRHDTESELVAGFCGNKSDMPNIESSELCEVEELTEQASVDTISESDSESEPFKPNQVLKRYEDKWLPKNVTMPASSSAVKRLSERNFIYMDKYPFEGAEYGFKCGLCPAVSMFYTYKTFAPWHNIIRHAIKWHLGDHKVRKYKTVQRCIKVAPNRFQYGKYSFELIDGKYQCGECGALKEARAHKDKNRHILEHIMEEHENPSRTFICEYCGMVYRSREGLRVHKITHHEKPDGQFPCRDCGKIFTSRDKVVIHQKRVHLKMYLPREFICEICGKKYSAKAVLNDHVAFIHKGQKVKCQDCGKMFGSKVALGIHRNAHTGRTKYVCDVCGMNFTQHYSVTRHKKTAHKNTA